MKMIYCIQCNHEFERALHEGIEVVILLDGIHVVVLRSVCKALE